MLTSWKQAKQQFRFAHFFGNGRNSHFLFAFIAFVFAGGVLNSQGRDYPRNQKKTKKQKKHHCPLPNFGLSNELLHVVLASLCILSPSAQFCYRAMKQRRNLQLTFRSHFSESISFERLAPRFRCASCPFLLGKKSSLIGNGQSSHFLSALFSE